MLGTDVKLATCVIKSFTNYVSNNNRHEQYRLSMLTFVQEFRHYSCKLMPHLMQFIIPSLTLSLLFPFLCQPEMPKGKNNEL